MTLRNPSRPGTPPNLSIFILALLLAVPTLCPAQSNLVIYSDSLATGWLDWSYSCTKNFANTAPVHSGTHSISVNITSGYGALQLGHAPDISTVGYSYLSFWLNGSTNGGQQLQVYGLLDQGGSPATQNQRFSLNTPLTNTWQQYFVPLSAIGVANATNFDGFAIQDDAGSVESTFYLDDIQLVSVPTPAVVHLTMNAGQPIRTADARWFGINAAQWDSALDTPQTIADLTNMGTRAIRLPGGSDSDDFHWLYNRQDQNTWTWPSSPASFIQVITNINALAMTTVNYGTGFTNEAAAWVAYCNATAGNSKALGVDPAGSNWFTAGVWAALRSASPLGTDDGKNFLRISRSAPLGFKYWEIGNEEYGSWETDSNGVPHDPFTYASRARDYISLMKGVDPTIKIGVVVTPGEDSYADYTNHPVVNPRTGQTHYGWTPVLLATLKSLGVTPDFIIHHRYPQGAGAESDAGLLQASGGWPFDAANLRQMITDYFGTNGTNIEILCTENNSVSSGDGKQTTSLVNGLFMADSLAQLMQTEFNGLFWWNLENGGDDIGNNNDASLYGWRLYGDYGILEGTNYYPPYYTAKLMQHFVQPGDTVLAAASDYLLLSTYAVQRQDGSMTILTINKDPTNTLTGQLALSGFVPSSSGTIYSYGIPQDNAAEFGIGSPDVAQTNLSGAATNFSYAFPPYSATVMALPPGPAKLLPVPPPPTPGQVVFQLQGQIGVPYVIQRSTNLVNWIPVSTNKLLAGTLNLTNSITPSSPEQFWRAVWLP
jgi:hypothetical protein